MIKKLNNIRVQDSRSFSYSGCPVFLLILAILLYFHAFNLNAFLSKSTGYIAFEADEFFVIFIYRKRILLCLYTEKRILSNMVNIMKYECIRLLCAMVKLP